MGEFYVKKTRVEYELSNGKTLIDEYNKEKEKELKSNLDKMEETISFKDSYKPYDFSFFKFESSDDVIDADVEIENEVFNYITNYANKTPKSKIPNQLVIGINQASQYKDKWIIYGDNGKNNTIIKELESKPYCARVDYFPSKNKAYLQYMLVEKGKVVKKEFDIKVSSGDDDILKEYLK